MNKQYRVTASALNIRTGPGVNYGRTGTYYNGNLVTVTETKNGWARTAKGWVSMDYLAAVGGAAADNMTTRNLNVIAKLHPDAQAAAKAVLQEAGAAGLPVIYTDGIRTKAEQDDLYAQGRTKPGSIVTNVKYPNSAHNWGVAVDFCRNVKGKEYDNSDGFFNSVGAIGKKHGFTWGGDWTSFVDRPHLELKKFMPGSSTKTLVSQYGTPEAFQKTWGSASSGGSDASSSAPAAKPWYEAAQTWAKEKNIADGNRPTEPATRAEVWQMLKNYHNMTERNK